MQSARYFQIGGFGGHLKGAPERIAEDLRVGERGITLVLGIRPSGVSCLLMPEAQWRKLMPRGSFSPPWLSDQFDSLSPVRFVNKSQLITKLHTLESPRRKNGPSRDRSKANRAYVSAGEGRSDIGIARASFEHQRIFTMLRRGEVDDPSAYALQPAPWLESAELFSFVYNTWTKDIRTLAERLQSPVLLDVAWVEFVVPREGHDLIVKSAVHFLVNENRVFNNPGMKKLEFSYGETEKADMETIRARLQTLFSPADGDNPSKPKILFVYDKDYSLNVLRVLGVDTSNWEIGIANLLYRDDFSNRNSGRVRSRSPRRYSDRDPRSRPRSPRPRSPPRSSVYVIDVRSMFMTLRKIELRFERIPTLAETLRVQDTTEGSTSASGLPAEPWWCAGNECRLLGRMWWSMARGPAIDEQWLFRWGEQSVDEPGSSEVHTQAAADDEDSDVDPNDMVSATTQTSAPVPSSGDPYADLSDYEDY